jgi:hypothetical protein
MLYGREYISVSSFRPLCSFCPVPCDPEVWKRHFLSSRIDQNRVSRVLKPDGTDASYGFNRISSRAVHVDLLVFKDASIVFGSALKELDLGGTVAHIIAGVRLVSESRVEGGGVSSVGDCIGRVV